MKQGSVRYLALDAFLTAECDTRSSGTNEENNLSKGMEQLKSLQERYSAKDREGQMSGCQQNQHDWSESSFFWVIVWRYFNSFPLAQAEKGNYKTL